jgi:hypothetical protein
MAISEYFKQHGDWQQQTAQQSAVTMEQQKGHVPGYPGKDILLLLVGLRSTGKVHRMLSPTSVKEATGRVDPPSPGFGVTGG